MRIVKEQKLKRFYGADLPRGVYKIPFTDSCLLGREAERDYWERYAADAQQQIALMYRMNALINLGR
ncbi:hypothetical protein J4402_04550 [Candidatus Pacearchaeota archaeon]|nr:hypothetical protein [Candidatus Pacearchaeota archaeon]